MWLSGTGVPSGTLVGSVIGDYYLALPSGLVYSKTLATTWTPSGSLAPPQMLTTGADTGSAQSTSRPTTFTNETTFTHNTIVSGPLYAGDFIPIGFGKRPGTVLRTNAMTALAASTYQAVSWVGVQNANNAEPNPGWGGVGNPTVYTIPRTGRYLMSGIVIFSNTAGGYRQMVIRRLSPSTIILVANAVPVVGNVHSLGFTVSDFWLIEGEQYVVEGYSTVACTFGGTGSTLTTWGITYLGDSTA
jgi:hypothetical protein